MGSIPLPALEGRQPAPPSTLNAVAQMEAIKASQQEQQVRDLAIQQQQMQLNDQKAMTAAMQEWDGNDWNQMPLLIRKHGGSANAIIGMQNQILQRQRDLATLSKDQLANEAAKHDQVVGALSPLTDPKQVSDADLPNAIRSTAQDLMKRGLLDPQHEQTAEQLANLDPATARAQLGMFSKGLMGEKAQVENAAKQAEVNKNNAQANAAKFKEGGGGLYDVSGTQPVQVAGPKAPDAEREFQAYYQSYLAAKGQQPSAQAEYDARKQYFKDKNPYGGMRIQLQREALDERESQDQVNNSRKDTDFIDKNYVKPANDVEKSYQMFMDAYNNRNNAKTGAESMLALSTHLATTFGNVKGARVTKDMIEHHLGARSISDDALVAVQKLTNGDTLSPDQWDAFKGLITQSRNLTWDTAQKEAKRRQVDISGSLPADRSGTNDPFSQFGGKARGR